MTYKCECGNVQSSNIAGKKPVACQVCWRFGSHVFTKQ